MTTPDSDVSEAELIIVDREVFLHRLKLEVDDIKRRLSDGNRKFDALEAMRKPLVTWLLALSPVLLFGATLVWNAAKYPDREEFDVYKAKLESLSEQVKDMKASSALSLLEIKNSIESLKVEIQRANDNNTRRR